MTRGNKETLKQEITRLIDRHLHGRYLLIAFGSFARGRIDRLSDIDLALYSESPVPTKTFLNIRGDLEQKAHTLRSIDLINLNKNYVNPKFLRNILKEGVLWKAPINSNELLKNLRKRLENIKKR